MLKKIIRTVKIIKTTAFLFNFPPTGIMPVNAAYIILMKQKQMIH
jgi:hypothetical protein